MDFLDSYSDFASYLLFKSIYQHWNGSVMVYLKRAKYLKFSKIEQDVLCNCVRKNLEDYLY